MAKQLTQRLIRNRFQIRYGNRFQSLEHSDTVLDMIRDNPRVRVFQWDDEYLEGSRDGSFTVYAKRGRIWAVKDDDKDLVETWQVWVNSDKRTSTSILQIDVETRPGENVWYNLYKALKTIEHCEDELEDVETYQCNVMGVRRRNRRIFLNTYESLFG